MSESSGTSGGAAPTGPPLALAERVAAWGPIATTVMGFVAFGICLGLARASADATLFTALCGTAGAIATNAAQHWFGSSASSQKKDATQRAVMEGQQRQLQSLAEAPPAPVVVQAATPVPVASAPAPKSGITVP